ncbi:hypothetical protein DFH08DRAFT_971207 [Mycena albidolilacea]|uniref:Uncharacterized protein n=1 Tax=Mycena albidolilacea TaxID=1033008 RepID=A0AAD6ZDX5_9AGAR|nr:hypothetical protein DFH08DRAFT_971207 [Mycena albidolilacea]
MGAWPILDGSSKEASDSEAECKVVLTVFWQRKEKVKSYQEFLKLRGWKDGSLACSKAIASRRASIGRPPLFRVWLQKRIAPYPITAPTAAAVGWGNAYGWTTRTVWGTDGVWGNGHGWGHNDGWSDTTSDDGPPWDGVTMVPKTRGKKRRQCRRRHRRWLVAEAQAKAAAAAAAAASNQLEEQWEIACA